MLMFQADWKIATDCPKCATAKIIHDNPKELLTALKACGFGSLPTVEELLVHLFVKQAAWASPMRSLLITVKYLEEDNNGSK